jgi:glycine/D-amino acid oxidase-like deaminating enzyme
VVQSADGSLVVGDSHHYGTTIDPFARSRSEALILDEMQAVLQLPHFEVVERWVGYYPSGPVDAIVHPLAKHASLVSVTSGTGMSTSFALAQEWAKERL